MKYNYNMSEKEKLQYEEFASTVVLVWQTTFKDGFVTNFVNGFNHVNFVATTKEYYEAIEQFLGTTTKVIGTNYFTLEEWEEKYPEPIEVIEKKKKLNRWGEDISEGALNRSNTNSRYWKYL